MLGTHDIVGGAARAAYRIHRGLISAGVESRMLVRYKTSDDPTVLGPIGKKQKLGAILHRQAELLPLRRYPRHDGQTFSPGRSLLWPEAVRRAVESFQPDIVNPQWVAQAFSAIAAIGQLRQPVVWTLQDMWAMTGGCHYAGSCEGYTQSCGSCPQLGSAQDRDLSRRVMASKRAAWAGADLTLVPISHWLSDCVGRSSLLSGRRREVIPNGLDTRIYHPTQKATARSIWGLPAEKKIVLFGAVHATQDRRKGFALLLDALRGLRGTPWQQDLELVVFGASHIDPTWNVGLPIRAVGHLHDDVSLSLLYSAADVMIVPSIEEAFGQTASESMACGTPVVAFEGTGVADIVDHRQTGYLARSQDTDDLRHGVLWVLEDVVRHRQLAAEGRKRVVERFDIGGVARRYVELFDGLLSVGRRARVSAGMASP